MLMFLGYILLFDRQYSRAPQPGCLDISVSSEAKKVFRCELRKAVALILYWVSVATDAMLPYL